MYADTAWKYGNRWVVLAVRVRFPFAARPGALGSLVDLDRSETDDRRRGRPHRTPAQRMCRPLCVVPRRLPGRGFVFVGDSGDGTHEVSRFVHRHRARLTLVSKRHLEANRYNPPPPYRSFGRPRV